MFSTNDLDMYINEWADKYSLPIIGEISKKNDARHVELNYDIAEDLSAQIGFSIVPHSKSFHLNNIRSYLPKVVSEQDGSFSRPQKERLDLLENHAYYLASLPLLLRDAFTFDSIQLKNFSKEEPIMQNAYIKVGFRADPVTGIYTLNSRRI